MASIFKPPNPYSFAREIYLKETVFPAVRKWLLRVLLAACLAAIFYPYQSYSEPEIQQDVLNTEELVALRIKNLAELQRILDACLSNEPVILHDGSVGRCNWEQRLPADPEFKAVFFPSEEPNK